MQPKSFISSGGAVIATTANLSQETGCKAAKGWFVRDGDDLQLLETTTWSSSDGNFKTLNPYTELFIPPTEGLSSLSD